MIKMNIITTSSFIDLTNVTFNNSFIALSSARGTTTIINETATLMPLWIRIITLACMIMIDICAFFGNLLVICAFFRTRRLQTVTNYFIASLAFADALVAIFVLPLGIYVYQKDRSWKLGLILCDLWVSSDVLLCTSSILNLTCISVDRYMAITKPLTYTAYRSKFLARVMILLVWIVSAVITCPPIFGWRDTNRRQMVEEEHKCDLNTARGYVVYSALGSFYIPAVIMIFVYIRIFMVVYDRENLIKKFHEKDYPASTSSKYQNGSINNRNLSDGNHVPKDKMNDRSRKCLSCLRSCWRNSSSSSSIENHCSTPSDVKSQNQRIITKTNSLGHSTLSNKRSPTLFCRPCSLMNRRKKLTLDEEISHYRRQFVSGLGAEYRFRTGDSPCYERKRFIDALEPLNNRRTHSLEDLSNYCSSLTDTKQNRLNPSDDHLNSLHAKESDAISLPRDEHDYTNLIESKRIASIRENQRKKKLYKATDEIIPLSMLEPTKSDELRVLSTLSKRSPTVLTYSSLIGDGNFTQSSTYSTLNEHGSLSEQKLVNHRIKLGDPTTKRSRPSKIPLNNSSLKSNYSVHSVRRLNDVVPTSRCCCCLAPIRKWYEKKSKHINGDTPNHSLTNDEEEDEKVSSNDVSNRLPVTMPSHPSLRAIDSYNHTNANSSVLSSLHQLSSVPTANSSHDVHRRERIRFLKEQKTAKTLAVVVGGFILFWLPFFIMYVIPPETYAFNSQTVTLITWLGYCNSVINPFIYAYCSKQFRMAFWNITFGTCFKKTPGLLPLTVNPNHSRRPLPSNSAF